MFHPTPDLLLCYVTDSCALGEPAQQRSSALLRKMQAAAHAGVQWIQIREKHLSARELSGLVARALQYLPASCCVLVNDRLDVACALGAGGVHLGEQSLPIAAARRLIEKRFPQRQFLVGVSVHSLQAAQHAARSGADYLIFGPVFATPSKVDYGSPQGVEKLAEVCRNVSVRVLAIGGVTPANLASCTAAGAAGVAAIRLFQDAADLNTLVPGLKAGVRS